MENNKYLQLARQAKADDNVEDAKVYYGKAREENPDNGEAKFFHAYYTLYDSANKDVPRKFVDLCKGVIPALKLVEKSDASTDEQLKSVEEIVKTFVPETWTMNRYMNKKNHETKIGDSYVKIFEASSITVCGKTGMESIRDLGDEIVKLYGDAESQRLAVIAWKEYVSLCQKWFAWAPKGEAEVYAEKIKKIEPSYEMPKKAGCISLADKKN